MKGRVMDYLTVTLTGPEYKALVSDAKAVEDYEKQVREYNKRVDEYQHLFSVANNVAVGKLKEQGVVAPLPLGINPLFMFARDLHAHEGYFAPLKDERVSFDDDIFRSRIRSWTIEGKAFSEESPEKKERKATLAFAKNTLKADDVQEILNIQKFHSQSLVQQVFTQAIQYAGLTPDKIQMVYSANYYKNEGQIRLGVVQRYLPQGEEKSPLGTIQFEYVLDPEKGFKLENGYPKFSGIVFKKLFLSQKMGAIEFTPELMQLVKAEEELRKICQEHGRANPRAPFAIPNANIIMAQEMLEKLGDNLMMVLDDKLYLAEQVKRLEEMGRAIQTKMDLKESYNIMARDELARRTKVRSLVDRPKEGEPEARAPHSWLRERFVQSVSRFFKGKIANPPTDTGAASTKKKKPP